MWKFSLDLLSTLHRKYCGSSSVDIFNPSGRLQLFELALRSQCLKDTTLQSLLRGWQKSTNDFSFSLETSVLSVLHFLHSTMLFK